MARHEVVPAGDAKPANPVENLWRDLRYTGRTMRKSPTFVLFVVLTLALGIGANTTVFTVINTLILNPLPVPDSSSLAGIGLAKSADRSKSSGALPISYADLKEYQARNKVFRSLAGYSSPRTLTWQTGSASETLFSEFVTSNYFSALGLYPARGRFFLPEEDGAPGAHPVAVMNYGTWQARFGGADDIVGKTIQINRIPLTIIGIAPPRFIGVTGLFGPDLWIPAAMAEQLLPDEMQNALSDRDKAFFRGVGRMPGVESVSWASNLPLWAPTVNGLQVEGRQPRSQSDTITAVVNTVDSNYFETAGVAIVSGREFTERDRETSIPVAIVNQKMAHDFWPRGDALGKRIRLPGTQQMRQIVGIARNANYSTWGEPPQLCIYVPLRQSYSGAMTLYVRSKGDPRQILNPVQHQVRAAEPQIVGSMAVRTGRQIVDGGLFQAKMGVALLSLFGLPALALASIGLYGIMAYSVNQRKREIGLRMALGAARGRVLRLILKQGISLVAMGVLIGLAASLAVGHLLSRMLFGVSASDPISVAGAAVTLSVIALLACYLPARWASRVDPVVALREG